MGTKISIIALSTMLPVVGLAVCQTVWAEETSQWTYNEMSVLSAELEAELDVACEDDDPECSEMYFWETREYNNLNRALGHYREHGLTVTAVNPENGTIRVAYDADVLAMGQRQSLKDLYVVQIENGYTQGDYVRNIDNGNEDALAHVTKLFVKNDASADWLPHGSEIELPAPELSVNSNFKNHIYVTYRLANGVQWSDYFDFSNCLASLEEGMECQIRYEANSYTFVAVPVAQIIGTEDSTESPTDTDTALVTTDVAGDGYGSDSIDSSAQAELTSVSLSVSAPNTGTATDNSDFAEQLPWWIGVIIGVNIAVLVWLFWPLPDSKHRKPSFSTRKLQKSAKKS